jgi:hypothetical protein
MPLLTMQKQHLLKLMEFQFKKNNPDQEFVGEFASIFVTDHGVIKIAKTSDRKGF